MSNHKVDAFRVALISLLILITEGAIVYGDSLEVDKEVLLNLKRYLEDVNPVNRGSYADWNTSTSPCDWSGISCVGGRVTGIDLSNSIITGGLFGNFSALTALTDLNLSGNTINGGFPADLGRCQSLKLLNLSSNTLSGELLNLTGLNHLEVLDLSTNRVSGGIQLSFPAICNSLVVANLSGNNFTGPIVNVFDDCRNLQFLDLSANKFAGEIWPGFPRLQQFLVSENQLFGPLPPGIFSGNCNLQVLDLSGNTLSGGLPKEISNCKHLLSLNIGGNNFTGEIPVEIGYISTLEALNLGSNNFSRNIPESLLGLTNLVLLDLSKNNFGGDIQAIFGRFTQIKYLTLHANAYTGGIYSSGILKLSNLSRLDLSINNFSGPLPVEISQMMGLNFLILAYNQFAGNIPLEYGNLTNLQALDLSYNNLNGSIPPSLGKLSSLLWLMLANNSLRGEIPPELGNCGSLLWLNLANNQLSGPIPPEMANIGLNATTTFQKNRASTRPPPSSGECLTMRRWIPADYPPFSFVYTLLTRKGCRNLWDRLLKGYGTFQLCVNGSQTTLQISGYVQLTRNQLSGEVPPGVGKMKNFSMLQLGFNRFYGDLPSEIGLMPLAVLNVTQNKFSGEIPKEIGGLQCLRNLDLSYNNFSGVLPSSLNNLNQLSKFNLSYNPYITGVIPTTGQLATLGESVYYGDPLLVLPPFMKNSTDYLRDDGPRKQRKTKKLVAFFVFFALVTAFLVGGIMMLVVRIVLKKPVDIPGHILRDTNGHSDLLSSSGSSSPWLSGSVKVISLGKTAFTHDDILKATGNFSDCRIIGRGGFGMVYRGVLPDGREVAIKRLQREGTEAEKEFRAEMELLSGNDFSWPHPNLVTLYGWCLDGSEKILVYEYMEGGCLENLVSDSTRLTWRDRINISVDAARALVFLHHECFPAIVHRDVKASNVLLNKNGKALVTDFGLARVVDAGDTHVSTMVAGTVGYVAPEYWQTWKATTKGDVYSFGVLAMELATGRRAVEGGDECLVEWARRVVGIEHQGLDQAIIPATLLESGLAEGAEEMCELLKVGLRCTAEVPQVRPNMKEVLAMLVSIRSTMGIISYGSSPTSVL